MMDKIQKKCFIITPIGIETSETRDKAEGVIEAIKPVLENLGFEIEIPHQMPKPGSITQQILNSILYDDLVIANLTELNPNVMYELAVRHASGKPVVTIAEIDTKLPFDITTERSIFYSNDMRGVPKLQEALRKTINAIEFDNYEADNPIYRAQKDFRFKEANTDSRDSFFIDQFNVLQKQNQEIVTEISFLHEKLMDFKFFREFPEITTNRNGSIKLIKASKDLSIGISTIVKYLETHGIEVDANPNARISNDAYLFLINEFGKK